MSVRQDKIQLTVLIDAVETAQYAKMLQNNRQSIRDFKNLKAGTKEYEDAINQAAQASRDFANVDLTKLTQRQLLDRTAQIRQLQNNMSGATFTASGLQQEMKELNDELARGRARTRGVADGLSEIRIAGMKIPPILQGIAGGIAAIGIAGVIQAGIKVVKSAITTYAEFERQLTQLRVANSYTNQEMEQFKNQALEVSGATKRMTGEVITVQDELSSLKYSFEDIIKMTPEIMFGAAANKIEDVGMLTKVTAGIMKSFKIPVEETGRVINTMTAALGNSALTFEWYQQAITPVAPLARQFNTSLESVTTYLSAFANSNMDARASGRALTKMMVDLHKEGRTLDNVLAEIQQSSDPLATAIDLLGKHGGSMASILADNNVELQDFLENLLNVDEALTKTRAEGYTKDLQGGFESLAATTNKFLITIGESFSGMVSKGTDALIWLVGGLTKVADVLSGMPALVKNIGFLGLIAVIIRLNWTTLASAAAFASQRTAIDATDVATKRATLSTRLLGYAMRAIPILFIIGLLADVVGWYNHLTRAIRGVTEAQDELNKNIAAEQGRLIVLNKSIQHAAAGSRERAEAIKAINENYGQYLPNLLTEKSSNEEVAKAINEVTKMMRIRMSLQMREREEAEAYQEQIQREQDALRRFNAVQIAGIRDLSQNIDGAVKLVQVRSGNYASSQMEQNEEVKKTAERLGLSYNEVARAVNDLNYAQNELNATLKQTEAFYGNMITWQERALIQTNELYAAIIQGTKDGADAQVAAAQAEREAREKSAAEAAEAAKKRQAASEKEFARRKKALEEAFERENLINEHQFITGQINESEHNRRQIYARKAMYEQLLRELAAFGKQETNEFLKITNELEQISQQIKGREAEVEVIPVINTRNIAGMDGLLGVGGKGMDIPISFQLQEDMSEQLVQDRFERLLQMSTDYQMTDLELQLGWLDEKLRMMREAGEQETFEYMEMQIERNRIAKEASEERIELNKKEAEEREKLENIGRREMEMTSNALISYLERDEEAREKNLGIVKAIKLAQIKMNWLEELSAIWKNNMSNPVNMFDFGISANTVSLLQTAGATIRMMAGVSQVQSLDKGGKVKPIGQPNILQMMIDPQTGQWMHAQGQTGAGMDYRDESGYKVAGVVHEKEYVIPQWMNEHPKISPVVARLEAVRQRAIPAESFAVGGHSSLPAIGAGGFQQNAINQQANIDLTGLERKFERMLMLQAQMLEEARKPSKNYILYEDIEDADKEMQFIRNRSKISGRR